MKKRALSLLMAFVMVIGLLPATVRAADSTLSGKGTFAEPYLISGADELKAFRDRVNAGENPACAKLMANIDLAGEEWTPITSLIGYLDGDGHTISNLTIKGGTGNRSTSENTGLIGELNGSIVNLNVTNVNITEGIGDFNNVGALVGKIEDGSTSKIDNCCVSGTITSSGGNGYTMIGGLVGYVYGVNNDPTTLTTNNCVSNVAMTGASSNYVGGLIGSAQAFSEVTVSKCAVLGDLSGKGTSGGIIGYINAASTALTLSDSYLGGKVGGSKKYGVAYNLSALSSLSCTNFYYDNEKNKSASSWSSFDMLNKGRADAEGKSTADLKALELDGFEVREGAFDGYPVPKYNEAKPLPLPKITVSATVEFTDTEGGTVTVKGPSGETVAPKEDKTYTLTETGKYTYTVTGMEQYKDVNGSFEIGKGDDGKTKTIHVSLEYKEVELKGTGTQEDPILISNALELRTLASKVNNLDAAAAKAYVVLEDDIVIPGSWTPLGKNAKFPFSGHFDGQGHSVTITVDDPNLTYFGFFGCLDSKPDRDSTTPIDEQPTVVVENLTVNGTVYCSEPYAHVGGIAGRARGKVEIKNCVNNATVSSLARGSAGVGGLVGGYDDGVEYVYWNICMTLTKCTNNGTIIVTGDNEKAFVGGMVGANANCVQVSKSNNTATINAPGCTVGGLLGEAGYQTGDFKPTIQDSSNSGVLLGAAGKTNNLYGKGTIRSGYLINSGSNTYIGGSESADVLVAESRKYNDVLAVPATAQVGDEVALSLKSGMTADETITVTVSQGDRDTNKAYLKVVGGKLQLAQPNSTGKVIEATATITWSKDGKSLSKPVTVNIYPAVNSRKILMDKIAATYTKSSSDWVVFDMAVYAKLDNTTLKTSDEAKTNYLNLTTNELAGNTPLVTDRAKVEIILAALGVNSTKLKTVDGTEYSNAAKLADMNLGSSHYTAPWVLLAEQAGQVILTDAQRSNMISLLTDSTNLGKDGLFFTKWAGETFADPDTTGTALAALAKYNTNEYPKVQAFVNKAVEGLSKAQNSNGSYGNVNSDAMVIIGLTAIGIDPADARFVKGGYSLDDPRFVKGGCSLADALLLYVNNTRDGFTTAAVGAVNGESTQKAAALATEQGFRALVALEKFESLSGDSKSFNIYTQTAKTSQSGQSGSTTVITPNKPSKGFTSDGAGTVPSTSTDSGTGGSAGSTTTAEWISVAVSIEPGSGSAWYSGSVRVAEGATVEQALETAAAQAGLILNIKDGYLRAVIRSGVTLGQYDEGPNSGWLYKVNGKAPNVGIADYQLKGGETVTVYYTADYTKESGLDISAPASGGAVGKTETVTNADGSTTKTETKPDGTVAATTTKPDGSTTVAETKPDGSVSTVEKRADGTEIKTAQPVSGEITASVSVPKSVGSTRVDIPVSKPSGSMVAVIVHPDGTEEIVKGSVVTETGVALRAEGDVRLKIIDNAKRFNDMADHWAKDAVEFASSRELFNGVGNDAFGPDLSMTRGMVSTVLARLAGADTAGGETWYTKGTVWAVENGISDGTNPEQPVTREQLAAMLYRYAGSPAVSGELSFDDTTVISIWAYDAVRWCVDNGILNGVGGNRMAPQDLARRGQVAAMLMRFLQATV